MSGHEREIVLGDAEQRHDHIQRIVDPDRLHEVAFTAGGGQLVDEPLGQRVHLLLKLASALGLNQLTPMARY